jgi:hypothetical protein
MATGPSALDPGGGWGHVSCLDVTPTVDTDLSVLAHGRVLLIDYFLVAGRYGVMDGDVELRWLRGAGDVPEDAVRVDDVERTSVFVRPELAPLLAGVRARLEIRGPRWASFLRRPAIVISAGQGWLEFFEARGRRPRY